MAINVIPASAGGGIKSVQRGQAVSAGNITITAVNVEKSFVRSFSEGSSGTVATNSSSSGTLNSSGGSAAAPGGVQGAGSNSGSTGFPSYSGTRTLSGGTMNATAKEMGAYLSDSTTLVVTGACRWEVVEFA
jgi:hypothetical protein